MVTKKEILALVKLYVEKKSSLDDFAHSFAPLFYDIEKTGDPDAVQLAYGIEAGLAAATAGLCAESTLQEIMATLLPSVSIVESKPISDAVAQPSTQYILTYLTAGEVVAEMEMVSLVYAGTAPSAGFSLKAALLPAHQTSTDLLLTQQVLMAQ